MNLKEFKILLREDKIYRRHIAKITKIELKDEAWSEELESLHARRDVRSLNARELLSSAQKIALENNTDNQAVRSRVVEIKLRTMRQHMVFENSRDLLKKYLPARYGAELKKIASTAHERKEVVEHILHDVTNRMDRMKHIVDLCDVIIDDCDQAGWTLQRINTVLEQRSREK